MGLKMFPHTITILNKSVKTNQDTSVIVPYYRKTVVKNVLFVLDENTGRNHFGLTNADSVSVYIPKKSVDRVDKTFVSGSEYESLSEIEQAGAYSFQKGDYVCFGDVGADGVNINELKNSGNLYCITGLKSYMFGSIPNYVIGAK